VDLVSVDLVPVTLAPVVPSPAHIDFDAIAEALKHGMLAAKIVGLSFKKAIVAIREGMKFFTSEPPEIGQGIDVLGYGIFDALTDLLPTDLLLSDDFHHFKTEWDFTMNLLPDSLDTIFVDFRQYQEDGDIASLVHVCSTVVSEICHLYTRRLPEAQGQQIARYFAGVIDILDGTALAVEQYTEGNITGAVQEIYMGIRRASMEVLQIQTLDSEPFLVVSGILDVVVGDLSTYLIKYKQHRMQSSVCWKVFRPRARVRPTHCPTDWAWDGARSCTWLARGFQAKGAALLDTTLGRKRGRHRDGAVAATCDDASPYNQRAKSWCYAACPEGLEAFGGRCWSACIGQYPIHSPYICGKTEGSISDALIEMSSRIARAATSVGHLMSTYDLPRGLLHTITTLVEVGESFYNPPCPHPDGDGATLGADPISGGAASLEEDDEDDDDEEEAPGSDLVTETMKKALADLADQGSVGDQAPLGDEASPTGQGVVPEPTLVAD